MTFGSTIHKVEAIMDITEKLTKLITAQIAVENLNAKEVAETEKKLGNAVAKLLLHIIAMDSQKHAYVLDEILATVEDVPSHETLWEHKLESYIDPIAAKKNLEQHMKREAEMIKHVKEETKQTKDEGLKMILQYVVEEEKKHHKMLETIIKNT